MWYDKIEEYEREREHREKTKKLKFGKSKQKAKKTRGYSERKKMPNLRKEIKGQ